MTTTIENSLYKVVLPEGFNAINCMEPDVDAETTQLLIGEKVHPWLYIKVIYLGESQEAIQAAMNHFKRNNYVQRVVQPVVEENRVIYIAGERLPDEFNCKLVILSCYYQLVNGYYLHVGLDADHDFKSHYEREFTKAFPSTIELKENWQNTLQLYIKLNMLTGIVNIAS